MTRPARIQLSRRAGFNLQEASRAINGLPAVNCARPGRWGNRYTVIPSWYHGGYPDLGLPAFKVATKAEARREGARIAVEMYRQDLLAAAAAWQSTRDALEELRGKNLACWCKPGEPCHTDVLMELANAPKGAKPLPTRIRRSGKVV